MELVNSKRVQLMASYVATEHTQDEMEELDRRPGRAIEKLNLIRTLDLTGDAARKLEQAIEQEQDRTVRQGIKRTLDLSRKLSVREGAAAKPFHVLAGDAAKVPVSALIKITDILAPVVPEPVDPPWTAYIKKLHAAPVGRLHLERIEMYPAGIEQGELIFTVPLAPKETVTISHKEWSTSAQEYEQIVSDYFESYSEKGVAEKTDASMSTENETKHANAFNFSSSVSGGYGPVTMGVTIGLSSSSENREAAKQSAQKSREVTEKASARTRKEHKVSVKLESTHGTTDQSFRTVSNWFDDRAIRVDYYRIMRKWRTDLYRYGLRLTFDVAVPDPGARLWALHRHIFALDEQIRQPFQFDLKIADVTRSTWKDLAATYGAAVEAPPQEKDTLSITKSLKLGHETFEFIAPPGMSLTAEATGVAIYVSAGGSSSAPFLYTQDPGMQMQLDPIAGVGDGRLKLTTKAVGGSEKVTVLVIYGANELMTLTMVTTAKIRPEVEAAWQLRAWTALRDAATAANQARIAELQRERDRLWMLLSNKDTLTLRRLEREELIRLTLRWLIGPDFDEAPDDVASAFRRILEIEQSDVPDDSPKGGAAFRHLSALQWSNAATWGEFVKFVHHAVEWENLLYFLYPYFWGSDDLAREKLLFEHPDPDHRDFLRAGYARVVVPIRPGFEEDFTEFLDTGTFTGTKTSPYLTIAKEVANFARTNYAGVPPANPEKHARPQLYPQQRKSWETMQQVIDLIETYYKTNGSYPTALSDLPGGPFKDAWGKDLHYACPGSGNDYDLISFGADGTEGGEDLNADISAGAGASLMASWFDYTPTSGIDIDVTLKTPIVV